jgi:HlyD family secretion protein
MRRTLIVIFLIAIIATGAYFGYQSLHAQAQPAVAKAPTYQTAPVTLGDLAEQVNTTGSLRANQTISLAWQTTGTIAAINVKIGDRVNAGQVLASLVEESLPQAVITAQADLVTARRTLDNLKNSAAAQAAAAFALAQAQQAVTDSQHDRDLLNYSRADNGNADAAWAAYYITVDSYNKALDRFNKVANLDVSDPSRANAQAALVTAQQAMQQKKAVVDWYTSGPSANDIAQADAKVLMAKAKLGDAQREWDRLKNGPDPQDIAAAEARIAAIDATLSLSALDAPFAGTVTDIASLPGDQVAPGRVSFRIDDLSSLLVDVQVPEVDVYRVQVGQPATLTFDALSGKQFSGRVDSVASVGLAAGGTINFKVTILLSLSGDTASLRPGLTTSVSILVSQVTGALLVPGRAVRTVDGQPVVYVLRAGALTRLPITPGPASDTYTAVQSSDLSAGDLVVLDPPVEAANLSGAGPGN